MHPHTQLQIQMQFNPIHANDISKVHSLIICHKVIGKRYRYIYLK